MILIKNCRHIKYKNLITSKASNRVNLTASSAAALRGKVIGAERKRAKEMKQRSEELQSIPGIGPRLTKMLQSIGVCRVNDLKGADPERLYRQLEQAVGAHVDRCVLYAFRNAVYFASHAHHDPAKLKWWYWKDK